MVRSKKKKRKKAKKKKLFLKKNLDALSPKGPQDLKHAGGRTGTRAPLTSDTQHDLRRGPATERPLPQLPDCGPRSPQKRWDPHEGSEWDSDLHSPRVFAQLHASSAPTEPKVRARPRSRLAAAERFPGDTRGRSPDVAKAVARAGLGAGSAGKGNGRGQPPWGVRGKVPPQLFQLSVWCHPFPERSNGEPGPCSVRPGLTSRQRCAELPPETGRDRGRGTRFSKYTIKVYFQCAVKMLFLQNTFPFANP